MGLVFVVGFILYLNSGASITISSDTNSMISISTKKDGEFKKIGTTNVTYKTRKLPETIYILSEKDGKKTISGILLNKGDRKEIDLPLIAMPKVKKIADVSLANPFISGTLIQGISVDTQSLISMRTDTSEIPKPEFALLPYLQKVSWFDENNFIYKTYDNEVGAYINGQDEGSDGIGVTVNNSSSSDTVSDEAHEDSFLRIIDFDKHASKPAVLLSDSSIYTTNDGGQTINQITGFKTTGSGTSNSVYSTENYIYRVQENLASDYDTKKKQSDLFVMLYKYNYTGDLLSEQKVFTSNIQAVSDTPTATFVLASDNLTSIKDKTQKQINLYYTNIADLASYKGNMVVLLGNGLWRLSPDGTSLQLLYDLGSATALQNSIQINGDSLLFGSQPSEAGGDSAIYSVQF